jgi:hypothetical protein
MVWILELLVGYAYHAFRAMRKLMMVGCTLFVMIVMNRQAVRDISRERTTYKDVRPKYVMKGDHVAHIFNEESLSQKASKTLFAHPFRGIQPFRFCKISIGR